MGNKIFGPAKTTTLKDHILELLADAIVSGEIKPGERLNELELARQFHVSRGPIREALSGLQEQGLAVNRPRRGIHAVNLTQEDIQKITSLRIVIEVEALRLCRARLTSEGERKLTSLVEKIENAQLLPPAEAIRLDLEFHRAIWNMSGNPYLERVLNSLIRPVFTQHVLRLPGGEKFRKFSTSHRALLEWVQGKSNLSAEKQILTHLSVSYQEPAKFSSLSYPAKSKVRRRQSASGNLR